jgi:hypothetical protein
LRFDFISLLLKMTEEITIDEAKLLPVSINDEIVEIERED